MDKIDKLEATTRKISRIMKLSTTLIMLWNKYPDMRFLQLVDWINYEARKKYDRDVFYLEDDDTQSLMIELTEKK